jgi:hypothetical protein
LPCSESEGRQGHAWSRGDDSPSEKNRSTERETDPRKFGDTERNTWTSQQKTYAGQRHCDTDSDWERRA